MLSQKQFLKYLKNLKECCKSNESFKLCGVRANKWTLKCGRHFYLKENKENYEN